MDDVINHEEARLLAATKQADSNLSRCYLAITADNTRLKTKLEATDAAYRESYRLGGVWRDRAEAAESQVAELREREREVCESLSRYVTPDSVVRAKAAMAEIGRLIDDLCRIRGECDADENLKRFVHYIDHALVISPGEVSRIIDFAQGQMKRAETAEAAAGAMREALERAVTYVELTYDEEGGEEAAEAKHDLDVCKKALSPTIGAEVMRVVRAAEKVVEEQTRIHNESPWPQKYRAAFGTIAEMADALAALGGTQSGIVNPEDANGR